MVFWEVRTLYFSYTVFCQGRDSKDDLFVLYCVSFTIYYIFVCSQGFVINIKKIGCTVFSPYLLIIYKSSTLQFHLFVFLRFGISYLSQSNLSFFTFHLWDSFPSFSSLHILYKSHGLYSSCWFFGSVCLRNETLSVIRSF